MQFSTCLLVITLLCLSSIQAMHQSTFDAEYQEIPGDEESGERFLTHVCNDYFYTTNIAMGSKKPLDNCAASELQIIGAKIDKLYDEVVSLDPALSNIALKTTVCASPKVMTKRRDLLSHAGSEHPLLNEEAEEHQPARRLPIKKPLFSFKYTVNYAGHGICTLCNNDNSDSRRLSASVEGEMDHQQQSRHHERKLREAYSVIDFSVDGMGRTLSNGEWVLLNWRDKYGMQVLVEDAKGGYAPENMTRIFNSSVPEVDFDLGSPNQECPGGGPGKGSDGEPGKPGNNCIPQGNLIIIQQSNTTIADANDEGGVIAFLFDSPTLIGHVHVIGEVNSLEAVTPDDQTVVLNFTSFAGGGGNGAQTLRVNHLVSEMRFILSGRGGISEVGIFTPTTATEALSPEARSFIAKKTPLKEYIPYLEFDLSYYLTRRINGLYGRDASSCLYGKWVNLDVQMKAVKKLPTRMKC